jgi:hypothetical protein
LRQLPGSGGDNSGSRQISAGNPGNRKGKAMAEPHDVSQLTRLFQQVNDQLGRFRENQNSQLLGPAIQKQSQIIAILIGLLTQSPNPNSQGMSGVKFDELRRQMDRQATMMSLLSEFLRKQDEMAKSVIQNMR